MNPTLWNRLIILNLLVGAWSLSVAANPAIVITAPTNTSTYTTTDPKLVVAGAAVSPNPVALVMWRCETCFPASGSAPVGALPQGDWVFRIERLRPGANTIIVTARSGDGRTAEDEIIVTYVPSDRSSPVVTVLTNSTRDHRVTSGVTDLTGICSDNVECTEVVWSGSSAAGGSCSGGRSWTCHGLTLRPGANMFTITGRDAAGNGSSDTAFVTYDEPLAVTTVSMAPAGVNRHYRSRQLTASGGTTADYRWDTATDSSLGRLACIGLSLSASGVVSGMPTTTGTCRFTARVSDSRGRTASKPLSIHVAAGNPEGPHDYFDALKSLPEIYPIADCRATVPGDNGACSLRNQEQLDLLTNAPGPNLNPNGFVYLYGRDASDDSQDAAKVELTPCPNGCEADSGSLQNNQVIGMPIDYLNTGTLLVMWDVWFDAQWRPSSCGGAIGPQNNMKTFQIRGGAVERGQIYFETRHRFGSGDSCDEFAAHDNRVYPADSGQNFPNGLTDDAPYSPTGKNAQPGNTYRLKHSTWTRYVAYLELTRSGSDEAFVDWRNTYLQGAPVVGARNRATTANVVTHPDVWHAFTMWICDEGRECTRVLWRVPWKVQGENGTPRNPSEFDYQFNTSARANLRTGNVSAYVRNWVALRNYAIDMTGRDSHGDVENNPVILRKPVR